MDTLLAFDIEAGEHEIEMKYVSTPFYLGIGIGIAGVGILVALIFLDRKKGIPVLPTDFSKVSLFKKTTSCENGAAADEESLEIADECAVDSDTEAISEETNNANEE
jgi:hypothetical protein